MASIHVIHVVTRPDGGGAERLVRELVDRLPAHGVESRAIYFSNPRDVGLSTREMDLGLRGGKDHRAVGRLRRVLCEQLLQGQPTIVHSHLTWPLYFLPLSLMGRAVPMVYTEHSTHNRRRGLPMLRPLERLVYRRYKRIACISEGTREALEAWLGGWALTGRVEVLRNGSRLLPFAPDTNYSGAGIRLVSVGSLSYQKGFDIALRAVARLRATVDRYTIVGEGGARAKLEALAQDLGIRDKVLLPGYVDDVTPYLHSADIGLMPSRWEGFGLVAVEALSTGLPVVAADVAGMREVLAGCPAARLATPEDPISFANEILFAAKHLAGNREIANVARKHSERFGIVKMVESYAALYERVLHESV